MKYPAVTVVEPKSVLRGRQGVQLHHGIVTADQNILNMKLSSVRQDFAKFREGSFDEGRLGAIVASQWMRSLDNPIDVVVEMIEEGKTVAFLQSFENLTLAFRGNQQDTRSLTRSGGCRCVDPELTR